MMELGSERKGATGLIDGAPRDLLRLLVDRSTDLIAVVELDTGRLSDINETACQVLGYSRRELLSMHICDLDPTVDPVGFRAINAELRARNSTHWNGLQRRKDGSTFPVEVNLTRVQLEREYVIAVIRDVTGRHRAEAKTHRLAAALEQTAESACITDVTGRIEYVNAAFERMTGYSREEVVGQNPRMLQSGQHDAAFYRAMWETLGRGDTWNAMFTNRRKDGAIYRQHTSVTAIRDHAGRTVSYVGVGRDLGREILLEQQLAQALRRTQTVVDASPVGIITYRASGQAVSANKVAAAMTGGTVEQLVAQNFHAIESWRSTGFYDAAIAALSTGQEQRVEARLSTSFRRTVWLSARFVAFDFEGEPHLMAMLADISERKALEDKLVQAQKQEAIALLAGGIAHDFNNVLAVIMSFGALAREGLPPDDERSGDLDEVLKAAERGASLTRQLLTFSRQQLSEKRPTDLNEHLAQVGRFLARAVGENIRIALVPCARPVVVEIDPARFDQVLLNLAVNARDAMPEGGVLEIALSHGTEHGRDAIAQLTVSDTGVGMTDETKQRIFEPFFTTKERGKGSGLGLATCYGIVAEAGGTIRVTSALGKGTTFVIDLPICSKTVAAGAQMLGLQQRGRGERVLVVEDDHELRHATMRVLQNAGYAVLAAADGDEALAQISALGADLDLVVSDVVMPGKTGHDVEQHCREVSPRTAVILTSGYQDEANRTTRPTGASILRKPVPPDELLRAVAQVLSERPSELAQEVTSATVASEPSAPRRVAPSTARPERVLLLDDDETLAAAGRRTLEASGFEVVVAHTLTSAREALGAGGYDVLVADIGLPDGSGLDLLRELRAGKTMIPVVLITGAPSFESASQAVRGQVIEYLRKPVPNAELRRAVRAAADAGRIARLRGKLLASRFGDELVLDLPGTERSFASALAQLQMLYQPIVRAGDGPIYAYEALVRSDEPALATAPRLLAAAEALGRVDELGRAVRASVASTIGQHREGLDTIFVNLHPLEIGPALLDLATDSLSRFARRVVLEVTEQASAETGPGLQATLAKVRALGFRIAVDDLGAGYAGLSSLIHLRPEFVKIDMSLVRGVHLSRLKRDIIAGVVDIAHRSRITIIAEGVETEDERGALVELGCDLLQGYLLGKPGAPFPGVRR